VTDFNDLYSDFIMYHYKKNDHRGKPESYDLCEKGSNLSCGDEITLYLSLEDGRISRIRFDGHGCTMSQSSASVLSEVLEGKTMAEAENIVREFEGMLRDERFDDEILGEAAFFEGLKNYPLRIKCITLPWLTMRKILERE